MIETNEAYINKEWLTVENYQFKILVMIAVLAENHLAYRGKLTDMCDFLGVSNQTNNKNKIKEAIAALEQSGDIKTIKDGYTYTLTLSVKAEKKSKIIKIKNAWVKLIQNYKADTAENYISWENVLKVLVYLISDIAEVKTYEAISKELNISTKAIQRCITALDNIDFGDIILKRKLAWFKGNDDKFRVIGQKIDVWLRLEQ